MRSGFQTIKGTKDILPDETDRWRNLENTVHELLQRWSYREIRTPAFEHTDLFARSSGVDSDVVSKQMYTFLDKGNTSLTLKPELTAPVIRAYIQHNLALSGGTSKLYYIDAAYRQERPQKGRQRQFHQFGVEAIGSPLPEQDAEIITIAYKLLEELGVRDLSLSLNSIGSKTSRANYRTVLVNYLRKFESALSESSRQRITTNPLRILDTKNPNEKSLIEDAPHIMDYLDDDDKVHYETVQQYLTDLNIPFTQNHLLVRGLDYYSRTTFEITTPNLGAQNSLCGGGRYDYLVEALGGKPTPAVGFAAGIERILLAQDERIEDRSSAHPRIYVVAANESARSTVFTLTAKLRDSGMNSDFDTLRRSLKAQMREANRLNCSHAIIIGENEMKKGITQVKDLKSGTQNEVDIKKIVHYFIP